MLQVEDVAQVGDPNSNFTFSPRKWPLPSEGTSFWGMEVDVRQGPPPGHQWQS